MGFLLFSCMKNRIKYPFTQHFTLVLGTKSKAEISSTGKNVHRLYANAPLSVRDFNSHMFGNVQKNWNHTPVIQIALSSLPDSGVMADGAVERLSLWGFSQ